MHLATLLEHAAQRYPHTTAIIDASIRYSYKEIDERANAVAFRLMEAGCRSGERIAICAANREETASAYFGIQKAGCTAVFLNNRWKAHEIAFALDDSGVRGVLYDMTSSQAVKSALKYSGRDLFSMDLPTEVLGGVEYATIIPPDAPRDPDSVSTILYTSGTVGLPKGVPRTHNNDYHAALIMAVEHQWHRFERTLGVMPLFHTMGLHTLLSMVMLNGAMCLLERLDPKKSFDLIENEKISALYLVPTAFYRLVEYYKKSNRSIFFVTKLSTAGAPMPEDLAAECQSVFQPETFVNHYGSTEMHAITVNSNVMKKTGAVGRPLIDNDVRIVSADPDRDVQPDEVLNYGEIGEIIADMGTARAFRGYLNRPEETKRSIRDGWFFTGDLGFRDEEGDLYIVGRIDDMIISGGENIYPQEVEEVIGRHPLVQEAAVVGLPDKEWGEVVAAFVVSKSPGLTEVELERHCLESPGLARYKRPRRYIFIRELPKSPTGKLLRRTLKTLILGDL